LPFFHNLLFTVILSFNIIYELLIV
jgi:hypothetical protein